MELWYFENQSDDLKLSLRVSDVLHQEKTEYQELYVFKTPQYGRVLVLDNAIQTTDEDEFIYHEMITHVPLFTHKNPKKVLVVGGGDGGAVREILRHPSVEEVHLCEIDKRVVDISKEYFPKISCQLDNPKLSIMYKDGIAHVKSIKNYYDVIIIDSPDPVGPAIGLFNYDFYEAIHQALKDDGVFVAQTESPFIHRDLIKTIYDGLKKLFTYNGIYLAFIPTYQNGFWCFSIGSKKYDLKDYDDMRSLDFNTEYYTRELHKASYALPNFLLKHLEK